MSRLGVSRSEIERACEKLFKSGSKVTIDAVRAMIGGSDSTIAPVVRTWKAANGGGIPPAEAALPEYLVKPVKDLHNLVHANAEERIEQVRQECEQKIIGVEHALKNAAAREANLALENEQLTERISSLISHAEKLDQAGAADKLLLKELETTLSERTLQLAERDRSLQAAKESHQQSLQRAADELRIQRREANEKLDRATSENLTLRTEGARLEVRCKTAESHNIEMRSELDQLRAALNAARLATAQATSQQSQLGDDLKQERAHRQQDKAIAEELSRELNEVRLALAASQGEGRILQRDLTRVQNLYDKLNQEAVIHRQERAQMAETVRTLQMQIEHRDD